jgi:hypothetical protein
MSVRGVRTIADKVSLAQQLASVTGDGWLRVRQWVPLVLVVLGAIATRHSVVANSDVSWLITVAEKALDGRQLYVDVLETNPPASILLYVPPVAFAHAIGLRPELVVDGFVFVAVGASMWLAGRILAQARLLDEIDRGSLAACVATILTIVPAQIFGEREHIVVIGLLPAFAVFAVRARNLRPTLPAAVAAGIGLGMAVIIKPYFVLAIAPAILAVALCAKSWRTLFAIENWIAAASAVLYGAVVALCYPQFISDTMPIVKDVYVPLRLSLWTLFARCPAAILWMATLRVLTDLKPGALFAAVFAPLLTASFGFGAVFFLQGKGWAYHAYPMLALALIALAAAGAERKEPPSATVATVRERTKQLALVLVVTVIVGATFYWMNIATNLSSLAEPIRQIKASPTMLVISSDISIGHPLVRQVGGKWVGRVCSLWITGGVIRRRMHETLDPTTLARLNDYAARDRALLAEDIGRERPDIILVDRAPFDWLAWAHTYPAISALLQDYQEAETIHDFLILRRVR